MTLHKTPLRLKKARAYTLTEMAIVFGIFGFIIGGIWLGYGQLSQNKKATQAVNEIRFIVTKIQTLSVTNPSFLNTGVTDGGCIGNPAPGPTSDSCSAFGATGPCGAVGPATCAPCTFVAGSATPPPYSDSSTSSDATCTAAVAGIFPSEMLAGPIACPATPTVSSPWGIKDITLKATATSNACAANGISAANGNLGASIGPGSPGYVAPTLSYSGSFSLVFSSIPTAACLRILIGDAAELANMGLSALSINGFGSTFTDTANAVSLLTPANITYWCKAGGAQTVSLTLTFPTQIAR